MEEAIRGKVPAYDASRADRTAANESARAAQPAVRVLERVNAPEDLKQLTREQLTRLCGEIREYIIDVVSQKGGHLGASLGVVELTVALETVLDLPRDRVVWDTGHQAYVHKVLTGRRDELWSIRQYNGISGFLKRDESPYDVFGAGHASTAISAAMGLAAARDLAGDDHRVVAIIGDGAITGGLAYEALNNAGQTARPLLVILNDNGMSIAPNVGAISHYLTQVVASPQIKKLRDDSLAMLKKLPAGESVGTVAGRLEKAIKTFLVPGGLFESLGFSYVGPVDGHDLDGLLDLLPKLLQRNVPVLLHVVTRKGKGLPPAEADLESFHGVKPFDKVTGKAIATGSAPTTPAYTKVFGQSMIEAADAFPNMVAITAAMPTGTGLTEFQQALPSRFFDVGIAEAHGICFAAGMACDGARPVATIYSTFLQRAFDQIVHDVALQKLPVVFAIDRGGLVGSDGPTHHGVLDLTYLRCIPNMIVAAPKDGNEMRDLLWTGLAQDEGPFAFRYPRENVPAGYDPRRAPTPLTIGTWETIDDGDDLAFLAVGTMVKSCVEARDVLAARGVSARVVNCRFVKPMDVEMLAELRARYPLLVTVEENSVVGGFGDGVLGELEAAGLSREGVVRLGLPDRFVTHGTRKQLLNEVGLLPEQIADTAQAALRRVRG